MSAAAAATAPAVGLVYVGRMYSTSGPNPGDDSKQDHSLLTPLGAKIDRSYHQTGPFSNSGGGAQSDLSVGDIPPGFHVVCSGSDTHGKRWSVLKPYSGEPILTGVAFDPNDVVTQWKITFGLYSDTGTAVFQGGANTNVDVWYKPRT
jgi:hypothetical protein